MRIIIIGAGLSGLAMAFRLRAVLPDAAITILEANPQAGGHLGTISRDGFHIEIGPNGFLDSKPGMKQLAIDLNLGHQLIPASEGSRKNRFLCLNGSLVQLPASPIGLLTTKVLSLRGKLALLREPWRRRPFDIPADESVADFARRRFGVEAAETIVDALVTGIHGGDAERLSIAAAFPRLPLFERESGSVLRGFRRAAKARRAAAHACSQPRPGPTRMWSFPGGLQTIVDALTSHFTREIHSGVRVRRIEKAAAEWVVHADGRDAWRAEAVVVMSPPHLQATMLSDLDAAMASEISAIGSVPITVVALGYKQSDAPTPDGFGYIAPQRQRRDVIGVQWCSTIFPGRAPPGYVLWRALCGGAARPDAAEGDDETILRRVQGEMQHVMKVKSDPVFTQIIRWPRAIPQYEIGHIARVQRIEDHCRTHAGLFLGGNAYHGIAMNDCAEQALGLAARVRRYFEPAAR